MPQGFVDWIKDNNKERIDKAEKRGTVPYFIVDNRDTVKRILEGSGSSSKPKEDAKENKEDNQQSTRNPLTEQQKQRREACVDKEYYDLRRVSVIYICFAPLRFVSFVAEQVDQGMIKSTG